MKVDPPIRLRVLFVDLWSCFHHERSDWGSKIALLTNGLSRLRHPPAILWNSHHFFRLISARTGGKFPRMEWTWITFASGEVFRNRDIRIEGPESPQLLDFFVEQLTAAGLRVHWRVSDQLSAKASFETGWGPMLQVEPQAFLAAFLAVPFYLHEQDLRTPVISLCDFLVDKSCFRTFHHHNHQQIWPGLARYMSIFRERGCSFSHSVSTWSTCPAHQKRPKSDGTYTFIRCYKVHKITYLTHRAPSQRQK